MPRRAADVRRAAVPRRRCKVTASGFNPDYMLAIGDRVLLRIWGSFNYEAVQTIDPQGNVFVPNVGPVRLAGRAQQRVSTTSSVRPSSACIATTSTSMPRSKRRSPCGCSSRASCARRASIQVRPAESVLGYLTRAGGVDPSARQLHRRALIRSGEERAAFDLYEFLLDGRLAPVQLQDGDTLVVGCAPQRRARDGRSLQCLRFRVPRRAGLGCGDARSSHGRGRARRT